MTFGKSENGVRYVIMPDWALTLIPVSISYGSYCYFWVKYYENGTEELSFIVHADYLSPTYIRGKRAKFESITHKVIPFFDVFKKIDELEKSI